MDIQYVPVNGVRLAYEPVASVGHILRFAEEMDIL
jgi:hypothetical protein